MCFLSSPRSRGSLIAARLAARFGVSVYAFCLGFSPLQLPRLRRGGSWSFVEIAGVQAVHWQPRRECILPKTEEGGQKSATAYKGEIKYDSKLP